MLTQDDVDARLSVLVSYTDGRGTEESVTSAETTTVENINDAPVGTPVIDGAAREGNLLTVNTSTIRDADLVIVINDGRIVEQGTHQQLLRLGGIYHHLYISQFKGHAT